MNHPSKEQFQVVIDRLSAMIPFAQRDEQFNMHEPTVIQPNAHACGTVHCVGGWYIAYEYMVTKTPTPKTEYIGFGDGVKIMAKDLGFGEGDYDDRLQSWAKDNPEIWGNSFGYNMFSSSTAYNQAKNLSEVVEWFKGVQSRLPEKVGLFSETYEKCRMRNVSEADATTLLEQVGIKP